MANKANTKLSRYTLMKSSEVIDENSGEAYPDIFTVDYSSFDFTEIPSEITIELKHLEKPFYIIKENYGIYVGDDILLNLNLIPHYKYLTAGDTFYVPSRVDFNSFIKLQTSVAKSQKKL